MKLSKNKWTQISLGEVCVKREENDKENAQSRFDKFIKVEHLDAENINIKRWGKIGSEELPPTFYKIFRKGQILYPTRNPHLKRAALASFDGICGEKTLTLEPNLNIINRDLFPFIFVSSAFYNHTTSAIVGSTNPHVRWRDVAEFKFKLPPREQQVRLAELLRNADFNLDRFLALKEKYIVAYNCFINEKINEGNSKPIQLKDVFNYRKGLTYKSEEYSNEQEGLPLLNLKSIERGGGFNKNGIKYYNGKYNEEHFVKPSDLIIACTDITREGLVVGYPLNPKVHANSKMLFTMDLIALELKSDLFLRDYLYYLLKTKWAHAFFFARSPGTTVLHLNTDAALKLKIEIIDIKTQSKIVNTLKNFEENLEILEAQIDRIKKIQKQLINQIFG